MPRTLPTVIPRLAETDFDIFREMYRSGWGIAAGVDPRLNANRIAHRLGLRRDQVDSHLKQWTRYGFLERFDVRPNPALFDLFCFSIEIHLVDSFHKDKLIERIGLLDGAVGCIDYEGDSVSAQFVALGESDIQRTTQLIRGLAGVAEVGDPIPWTPLKPRRVLTPLDLRIVRVLRNNPTQPLSDLARQVGVSTRTITTRYGHLVDNLAVWFVPVVDCRALAQPIVRVRVTLGASESREIIARSFRKAFPHSLEVLRVGFGLRIPDKEVIFIALCPSAARIEELEGFLRHLPGVESVDVRVLIRSVSFPATFDRLVAAKWPPGEET